MSAKQRLLDFVTELSLDEAEALDDALSTYGLVLELEDLPDDSGTAVLSRFIQDALNNQSEEPL